MKCDARIRPINSLRTLSEVRDARRELALREIFMREALIEDAHGVFSWGGLLSMVLPDGTTGLISSLGGLFGGFSGGLFSGLSSRKKHRRHHDHPHHLRRGEMEIEVELD